MAKAGLAHLLVNLGITIMNHMEAHLVPTRTMYTACNIKMLAGCTMALYLHACKKYARICKRVKVTFIYFIYI